MMAWYDIVAWLMIGQDGVIWRAWHSAFTTLLYTDRQRERERDGMRGIRYVL